jgi:hypothetical protein
VVSNERKFLLGAGAVFLLMFSHVIKGRWGGGIDIWEHAAAVKELAEHPLNPHHPLFPLDAPHQFLSPYHLFVALMSRIPGVGVVTALNLMALVNLVLLLLGIRLFLGRISPHKDTAFWAVLFIVFCWGPGAWFFSSFLHFDVLPLVLSYPSTFAKAAVFLCLWAHTYYLERRDPRLLLPSAVGGAVILLVHPVDALFLFVGIIALTIVGVKSWHDDRMVILGAAGVIAVAFAAAFAWPYFSLSELLWGKANAGYREAIDGAEKDMYVRVLSRAFPALLALPFLLRRAISRKPDILTLFLFGLLVLYGFGWATDNWAFGRLISPIVMVALIVLAEERAAATTAARALGPAGAPLLRWVQVSTLGLVMLGGFYMRNGFIVLPDTIVKHFPYGWVHSEVDLVHTDDLAFISRLIDKNDVVMSDLYTSLEVPAFGPKVVAVARTEAFVDTSASGAAVGRFFDPTASMDEREQILRTYNVDYLLLTTERLTNDPNTYEPLRSLGRQVYENKRFVLIDVGDSG